MNLAIVDPMALLEIVIPLLAMFGVSIIIITLVHLILTTSGNRFATEISSLVGLLTFVIVELIFGMFAVEWTLVMLVLVTALAFSETLQSLRGFDSSRMELLKVEDEDGIINDVLCFSTGGEYIALAATSIKSVPLYDDWTHRKDDEDAELKWLYPLWEDGHKSNIIYTLESTFEKGLSKLRIYVSSRDKNWKQGIEKARRARQIIETWLMQKEYEFAPVVASDLKKAYSELNFRALRTSEASTVAQSESAFIGALYVEGIPVSLSCNIGNYLQQLLRMKITGKVLVSFISGSIPSLDRKSTEGKTDPPHQERIPFSIEEHNIRKTVQQMAEIKACEETGSFRLGISVIVQESSVGEAKKTMKRASTAIQSVLGGVKTTTLSATSLTRSWDKILHRRLLRKTTTVSGARLTALLHLSEALPGIPSRAISPEYALPSPIMLDEDTVPMGYLLHKGKPTSLQYNIPLDSFCFSVGNYGNPGSGKTNTGLHMTNEIYKRGIPFLVIVPAKKEWRILGEHVPNLRIFTQRDIRFNFLEVPTNVPVATHISNITTCFIAACPSEGILREHIAKIFRRAYTNAGWDLYSDKRGRTILLTDLYEAMEEVAGELRYGGKLKQDFIGALSARFETLIDDPILSTMFNTEHGFSIPDLLNHSTILELNNMDDSHKALVTSLIMVGIAEYLEANCTDKKQKLKHLLVLEEAHHVLKQVSGANGYAGHSAQQHAIDSIVQLLREARGLGLGIVLIDQLPGHLATAAVKLPGITILHTLFDARERALVGGLASLTDEQLQHVGLMDCGEAVIHQGFAGQSVNIKIAHFHSDPDPTQPPWDNTRVAKMMEPFYNKYPHLRTLNIPKITRWKPDQTVLGNLRLVIENPRFLANYDLRLETGVEFAKAYVRSVVSKTIKDPSELDQYTEVVTKWLENEMGVHTHIFPIDADTTVEDESFD